MHVSLESLILRMNLSAHSNLCASGAWVFYLDAAFQRLPPYAGLVYRGLVMSETMRNAMFPDGIQETSLEGVQIEGHPYRPLKALRASLSGFSRAFRGLQMHLPTCTLSAEAS